MPTMIGRALLAGLALLAACREARPPAPPSRAARAEEPGRRIGMLELHQSGGVPPGWRFSLPPGEIDAGRLAFEDLGCPSCHRVEGERFSQTDQTGIGPELTGMGGHHPAEYLAESIANPDAVLVTGPGYLGPDGRSIMPSYPDLTLAQLGDVVAYLKSLRAPASAGMMMMTITPSMKPGDDAPMPAGPPGVAYWVHAYDVRVGRLPDLEAWFRTEGLPAFLATEGVVNVETSVDFARSGPPLVTVVAFRDLAALKRFLESPEGAALGGKLDDFIGPHQHRIFTQPPLYRAASLSVP